MACARVIGPTDSPAARPVGGSWEIAALPPGRASCPDDLDGLHPQWIACDGPVPAAAALRAAGQWDLDQSRDFDAEDWWYRCRFRADPATSARLRFEGLATIADVWLNRQHVLRSESMFIAHTVDIGALVRDENELVLCFHALSPLLAVKRPRPKWRTRLVAQQTLRWYRTSLLGRMPSWCPPVAPVGPWRPILIDTAPMAIEEAEVRTELEGDIGSVRVRFSATHPPGVNPTGILTVAGSSVVLACERLSDGQSTFSGAVLVSAPNRWWPHTHGAQPLYEVDVSIGPHAVAETVHLGRVGFRTIEIDPGTDGNGFGLVVNGTPVFCRGVCWTPLDVATLADGPQGYRSALEQLRDAGMNMLRIGGTMTYETDAFHDLCDQLGILVWQDFMFANMDYPWDDEMFARAALREATRALESLQHRPSFAVLCGSSEIDQQAAMLGLPESVWLDRPFSTRLAELAHAIAPGTAWLPTTPTGGTFPFQVDSGVSHYYGVGPYRRPFADARRAGVRFAAECLGFSNVPDIVPADLVPRSEPAPPDKWKARVPRDSGVEWDFEDIRDHYVKELFGVDPGVLRAEDWQRYLELGRVATGESMLRTFAEWRRPGSTCRGGLVWFARDLWPGAGWGVIDSRGRPKAAYWYLKRVFAPIALLSADEGLNGLWLHAINDTNSPIEADLNVARYRDGVAQGGPARTTLRIPARGHRSVHADALFEGFLDLTYAYKFGPPGHDVVGASIRDVATGALLAATHYFPGLLPMAARDDLGLVALVEPADGGYALLLRAQRFAYAVAVKVEGWQPDDNFFNLEAGETRRIGLVKTGPGEVPRGQVQALNGRGSVPLAVPEAAHAG